MTDGKNQLAQIILISTHTHHTQQSRCDRSHSLLPQWTLSLSLTSNMQVVNAEQGPHSSPNHTVLALEGVHLFARVPMHMYTPGLGT